MTQPPAVDPLAPNGNEDEDDLSDLDDSDDDEVIAPAGTSGAPVADTIRLVLREQDAGERLDRVLAEHASVPFSRSVIQRFIAEGRIQVDGKVIDRKALAIPLGVVIVAPAPPPPWWRCPKTCLSTSCLRTSTSSS